MNMLSESTQKSLEEAAARQDVNYIRGLIVTAGDTNFKMAKEVFDVAKYRWNGFIDASSADSNFEKDEGKWDEDYFFYHLQGMMRCFTEEAFAHYLQVGAKVFPERLKQPVAERGPIDKGRESRGGASIRDLPSGVKIIDKKWLIQAGIIIGVIVLGLIIYFVTGRPVNPISGR